jgi:hypothetical protein
MTTSIETTMTEEEHDDELKEHYQQLARMDRR